MADLDVFGWAADETGCGFYRIALPMQGLTGLGHRVAHSMKMPSEARDIPGTVIVGQRVCKPEPSKLWQQLAKQGRKLIYEVDDDLWNVDASSPVAHEYFARPEIRAALQRNIEVATAVTVTTDPLAERVAQWNPNVHIVPNAVPDWLVDHQPQQRDDGVLTIGWGGSATHAMDFDQVADQLRRFLTRNPGTEFHCIGNNYATWMRIPANRARFTPWVANVEDFLRTIDYHVGIAPLRPHVFNQAKSALKALEAGALGIPIVASAVRPYEDYVWDGTTGYLVRRDHEWAACLRSLAYEPDMRREMGMAAREQARQHTITQTAPLWEKAILG
ncbi:glycosyltransferase [Streptomyces malaysiensis]|uniref:D-inositol 3-phosphate glycosyltransferase n=1 Tax=Streptomyces malaysiensis subsp. samsunensis TaxID=459658 RepID=A0A9X2LY25_STRMQ|nr:glycosyltransferase [Streptomyces samsunensis]MCQ8831742.1 glycosyltransferase [Streptomyces samsunensis]